MEDASAWVFNRMAEVYDARPAYPAALIDAVSALAAKAGPRLLDLGAGTGRLALPLAARGFVVTAIEPAQAMLMRLQAAAAATGLTVTATLATAEALPLPERSVDCVVISDALHFMDVERTAQQLARVLTPQATLVCISSEPGDTPFMHGVVRTMQAAAPRRPRETERPSTRCCIGR